MTTVWVVKQAGHDLSPAKEYGSIEIITPHEASPFNVDYAVETIRERLKDAKDTDYLLPSGPNIFNMLVYNEWMRKFGKVRFLLFHARVRKYILREYSMSTDLQQEEEKTDGTD